MITRSRLVGSLFVLILVLPSFGARAIGDEWDAPVRHAKEVLQHEAETIIFFAHPTVTYLGCESPSYRETSTGFVCELTIRWRSAFDGGTAETCFAFHYDSRGELEDVTKEHCGALLAPCFGAAGLVLEFVKNEIRNSEELRQYPELSRLIAQGDIEALFKLYMKLAHFTNGGGESTRQDSDADLVILIRDSESMDDEERRYWVDALPRMTDDQRSELRRILTAEKHKLAEIDQKYDALTNAEMLIARGEEDAAVRLLTSFLASNSDSAGALSLRGNTYYALGRYEQAVTDWSRIIELSPTEASIYRNRSMAYVKLGDPRRALADARRALELEPDSVSSNNTVAWLAATCTEAGCRDGTLAVTCALKACTLTNWDNLIYLDTLAAAYAEQGDFATAVRWQEKALADPEFAKELPAEEMHAARRRLELYRKGTPWRE